MLKKELIEKLESLNDTAHIYVETLGRHLPIAILDVAVDNGVGVIIIEE